MEENIPQTALCQQCHIQVRPTDYFCFNCGKNLKPKPLPTDAVTQAMYYIGSILLPPMGIIWGFKYLREKNQTSKIIGIICVILTFIVIIVGIQATITLANTISDQVNKQSESLMQF